MSGLVKRTLLLVILASVFSLVACLILRFLGLKVLMICGGVFFAFAIVWLCGWLNDRGKLDTSKIIIFILIYIGALMAGFSYYLAYIGREEIAESLSKAAITELVAPAVMMLIKSLVENLSINNSWPDKSEKPKKADEDDNYPQI